MTTPGSDVDVQSTDDVQRLYLLLEPHQPPGGKCRLLVVPKKTLPDTKKHERFYAFVGEWGQVCGVCHLVTMQRFTRDSSCDASHVRTWLGTSDLPLTLSTAMATWEGGHCCCAVMSRAVAASVHS